MPSSSASLSAAAPTLTTTTTGSSSQGRPSRRCQAPPTTVCWKFGLAGIVLPCDTRVVQGVPLAAVVVVVVVVGGGEREEEEEGEASIISPGESLFSRALFSLSLSLTPCSHARTLASLSSLSPPTGVRTSTRRSRSSEAAGAEVFFSREEKKLPASVTFECAHE